MPLWVQQCQPARCGAVAAQQVRSLCPCCPHRRLLPFIFLCNWMLAGRDGSAQVQQWEADGVQMLLHWDPAAGSLVGTQPQQRYCGHMGWPTGAASTPGAAAAAADAQRVGMPGGRRIGYREPRQATAAGGGAGGWLPGRGSKRKWGTQ